MHEASRVGGGRFDISRIHRSGPAPQSVLVIGDHSFVDGPEHAVGHRLVDRIADEIVLRTGRGLDLDVLWDLAPAVRAVGGARDAWRLWRYEAVAALLPEHFGTWTRHRLARAAKAADGLVSELASASRLLLVRFRIDGEPDAELDARLRTAFDLPTVMVPADGGLSEAVLEHAPRIAAPIAATLAASAAAAVEGLARTAEERRAVPQPEQDRQDAVDRVRAIASSGAGHLERVVLLARNTFDVPFAQVNLVDHGRARVLAAVGSPSGVEVAEPLCGIAIRGSGPLVVADTWLDRRFDGNPHVRGAAEPVRFYAAHPIESPDGYRVGALCVFDLVPHEVDAADGDALRELAQLAEAELGLLMG
ncbi:GAF domain-containing protein [Amnibacterium setariae]|nr:GAF domain-containing protein [Amnibacterium setariae]